MSGKAYLAFDLGAESGRAILGRLAEGRIEIEEIHRFANGGTWVGGGLHWNCVMLFAEMKKGLALAAQKAGAGLRSLGIDTWGVDFGLVDEAGELCGMPRHYRDPRTNDIFDAAFKIVPREEIFQATGIQFLQFNTLFQLFALRRSGSPMPDAATRLLMMPDLFNFWFTGRQSQEFTNATTTQCYSATKGDWAWDLIDAFGLPRRIFGPVTAPGATLGPITDAVARETGAGAIPVVLPATHDTGSAVAAVPAEGGGWAFISAGTWALIGAETASPVISPRALECNFTNEGGAFGTNRLLTNVMGLWLLQQARRSWERDGLRASYEEIVRMASDAPAFGPLIEPDDHRFFNPPDMAAAIAEYCRTSGQDTPNGPGPTARCILESLALKYRVKIDEIEELTGRNINVIHIVGGGSRNDLLNQLTADASGRRVVAGPAEATALGNLLMQAAADGAINGLSELRGIVRASNSPVEFIPAPDPRWADALARFRTLPKGKS